MTEAVKYVGLDVHKETIAVAVADGQRGGEVRFIGTVANEDDAVRKLVKRLTGPGVTLNVCYEAGPCGYGRSCPAWWCSSAVVKLTGRALSSSAVAAGQVHGWPSKIFG